MKNPDSFEVSMHKLLEGDESTAGHVVRRLEAPLKAVVRRKANGRAHARFDSDDVLQSAFCSFFLRCRQGCFRIQNWDHLWSILVVIVQRKFIRRVQHHQAEKRSVLREESLERGSRASAELAVIGTSPSAEQQLLTSEILECLKRDFVLRDQEIIQLHLQLYSQAEIAERVGCSPRTVRRVIDRARKKLIELD